jgi:hypothetical protein
MTRLLVLGQRHLGVLLVGVLLLLLALPALAQEDDPVSTVDGDPIAREAFHARVRLVRWQYLHELTTLYELTGGNLALGATYASRLVANLEDPPALGDAVLSEMETERLLWQAGEGQGLAPAAADVEAQEAAFFSLWTNVPASELAASAEAQAFISEWYAGAEAASGLVREDILTLFATEVLRARLYEHLAAGVPAEEQAIRSRHILCSFHPADVGNTTPPTAAQRAAAQSCIRGVQARLATGESFAGVAAALSDDRASAIQGGDLGWVLLSFLAENYASAARDAALNTVIGPVETEFGLHLIEVLDRRVQALTAEELEATRQGYFDLWIETLRAEAAIGRAPDWEAGVPAEPALADLDAPVLEAIGRLTAR